MNSKRQYYLSHSQTSTISGKSLGCRSMQVIPRGSMARRSSNVSCVIANRVGLLSGRLTHMRATEFIRPTLALDILKAERVEDILPRLRAAAARAMEGTEKLAPEIARRL